MVRSIASGIRLPRRAAALTLALIAVVAYACASGGKGKKEALPTVNVEIENNLITPSDMTVYIRSGSIRYQLGFVPSGQTKTFTYTPTGAGENYYLEGVRQLQRTIWSQPFTISTDAVGTITWFLSSNMIGFRGRDVTETTYVK